MFDDVIDANRHYQTEFHDPDLPGRAAKGLAVLTCIDSRIDPLAMLGLHAGDAKIIRNAGGRATDDALRSLVLAANLLGVTRVCVVQHTDCAMVGSTEDEMRARVEAARGVDASGWEFLTTTDQVAALPRRHHAHHLLRADSARPRGRSLHLRRAHRPARRGRPG